MFQLKKSAIICGPIFDLTQFLQICAKDFNLKLSLLVEQQPEEDPAPLSMALLQGVWCMANMAQLRLDLLGFVAYKTWGPPVPGVSVGAVGVADKHRGKGYGRQLMNLDFYWTTVAMAVLVVH